VVAASVLEYVDDPTAVLRECRRVLRLEGVMLCTVPDAQHPMRWLEWLLGATARVTLVHAAGRRWPRLDGYLTYLRISRQRHSSRWWRTAATHSGLLDVQYRADSSKRSPLRLFVFRRADPTRGCQWPPR
jgi:ubiquinone/menaquinone biosynthesis C-methylase UbiE